MRSQVEQNGAVVEAMMPNTCPEASRYREAGAGPSGGSVSIGAERLLEALEDLLARDDLRRRPVRRAGHVHVLDESDLRGPRAGERHEGFDLVVVDAAHQHGVELDRAERVEGGLDAGEDVGAGDHGA